MESGENPASNLNSVCNNINFSVKIGNENPISTTSTLNNHSLLKQTYETVIVTISYQGDIYADGSFEVNFGDIELQYKSVDEPVEIAEENPWPVRGLKSAKVRYNKSYEIQNENEEMPEEITVYDNGALVADKSYTSNQVDNLISQSKVAVSNDNIIMKTESDSYMAIVFVEEDTTDVYLAPSNVAEFDTQSIVNNATTSATFEATSEEENPWIVTRGMDPKYVVFDSNYVSDGTPVMPLQYISLKSNGDLDLAGDIKDSSSVDDGIPNEMLVGTNYVIVRQSDSNIAFEFNKDYILTYMSTNTQDLTLDDIKENDVMESIAVNNSKSRRYVLSQ